MTALADRQKTVSDQELAEIVDTVRRQEGQSGKPQADPRGHDHPAPIEVGYGHGV
jgi:hypothetical protein